MYGIYLARRNNLAVSFLARRNNLAVSFLVPLLIISILAFGAPTAITQTTLPPTITLSKVSPVLLDKMATVHGNQLLNVLIETRTNDHSALTADIINLGGKVRYQLKYTSAIAASIPADKIIQLANNKDAVKIYFDEEVKPSKGHGFSTLPFKENIDDLDQLVNLAIPFETEGYETISITPEDLTELKPNTYWNRYAMNATSVWAEGYYGQGSLVAIIDTGIYSGHFMFNTTSIVGGIDISYDNHTRYGIYPPEYEGWDNIRNSPHGSHVAGILASTGEILVSPVHPLAVAIERYAGISLPTYGPYKVISLLGIAPNADLYIIKVFDHTSRGIPASIVIEAIEHAITLKVDEILDVDVISMSLGGPTLYDGRALLDRTVDVATEVGITVVSAAGNSGPASMTIASPGSAHTSITAGLAAHPVNTRVFWDYYFGIPEIGYSLYKADVPQIHWFGSRGPTSDGRLKPTVSATGTFVLSAYPSIESPQRLAFATGTSMSTPAVSGAVALLNSYAEANLPAATPEDYKQAITSSADWLEGFTEWDQGAGYLNAGNALSALKADTSIGDVAEPLPPTAELMDITNIPIVGSGVYTTSIVNLEPGHKIDFIFEVTEPTEMIRLEFTNVVVGENPHPIAQMIFPNSFEVYIQSAKRTFTDYYVYSANVIGKSWFKITDGVTLWKGATFGGFSLQYVYPPIEPGYVKITIESDWTNYVNVSADIKIKVTELEPQEVVTPDITISSQIEDGQWIGWMIIPIPGGTQVAKVELWWTNGWNKYPTSDLDVYIFVPDVGMNYGGATLNSPEKVDVDIDRATWFAFLLHGYAIYTGEPESFELRIYFK